MILSKDYAQAIINKLPIGYYIGKSIDVSLIESGSSYYDSMNDKICISLEQINLSLKSIENLNDVEKAVRCLVYHEVSHAFLTPKNLEMTDIVNIFEDERIETICKGFYKRVNFKKFVKQLNGFQGKAPKSAREMFYQVVRFRVGPKLFIDRVEKLIEKFKTISNCYSYTNEINDLYNDIKDYFDESKKLEEVEENEKNFDNELIEEDKLIKEDVDNESIEETEEVEENEEVKEVEENEEVKETEEVKEIKLNEEVEENEEVESEAFTKFMKDTIERKKNFFYDEKIMNDIKDIFLRNKTTSNRTSSAINSYSGTFDYRSVIRDDYKYFLTKNRNGHYKAFQKVRLNLIIDRSGSFWRSEMEVNKLLYALAKLEKLTDSFSFSLITCGLGQKVHSKDNRILHAQGGNFLSKNIYSQLKSVQSSDAKNINIVLFDGDAYSDRWFDESDDKTHFDAFDDKDTVIISDYSNKKYLSKNKSSKIIYCTNYAEQLYGEVLKSLRNLLF